MIWKESYRIGIESIDEQHKALFDAIGKLLAAIERNDATSKEVYVETVAFLSDYVARHFRDEEAYQASIGYGGLEAHRKLHQDFTQSIAEYAKKLEETNYDIKTVMELSGALMTWLVYHVTDVDQRIAGGLVEQSQEALKTAWSCFYENTLSVIQTMTAVNVVKMRKTPRPVVGFGGDVHVEMPLTGDVTGYVTFLYSKEFAYELLRAMAGYEPVALDEIVRSVVGEISKIIGKKAVICLAEGGRRCEVGTPVVTAEAHSVREREGFHLLTEKGEVQVLLSVV